MKIIPPFTINDARLVVSSIPEPDEAMGEIVWTGLTAYAMGTIRIRTQTHRKYRAKVAIANTVNTPPENDPTNWEDIGPTNRFAMFDYERNTASSSIGSIDIQVRSMGRASALLLFGIVGRNIEITVRNGAMGPVEYSRAFSLKTRTVSSWKDHFLATFTDTESYFVLDLLPYTDAYIDLKLSTPLATDTVALASMVIGTPVQCGMTQYGAESDIVDFSKVERDALGNATLVRAKNVPKLNATLMVPKNDVPAVKRLRAQFASQPLAFVSIDDSEDDYADALALVGIIRRLSIVAEYPQHAIASLEAEGI